MVKIMAKRFISKKNHKINFFKLVIIIGILYFLINFLIHKVNGTIDESLITKMILNIYSNKLDIKFNKINLNDPEIILNTALNYSNIIKLDKNKESQETFKENDSIGRIYIYNTHQTEEYDAGSLINYNIDLTVYTASNILKSKLKNFNIEVFVEDRKVIDYLNKYGYNYNQSYKITREFLETAPTDIDLYIDLHRDSVGRDKTVTTINNMPYAKVMFVVGTNYQNYNLNMDLATKLNNKLIEFSSDITRGIYTRHSVYNQDFSPNVILLELGGPYNTLEEIENTLTIFASIINDYLGG